MCKTIQHPKLFPPFWPEQLAKSWKNFQTPFSSLLKSQLQTNEEKEKGCQWFLICLFWKHLPTSKALGRIQREKEGRCPLLDIPNPIWDVLGIEFRYIFKRRHPAAIKKFWVFYSVNNSWKITFIVQTYYNNGPRGVSLNGPRFHLQTIAFEFINNGRSGYDNTIFKLDAQTRTFVVLPKEVLKYPNMK